MPDDTLDKRSKGASMVSFSSEHGSCGFDLRIVETVNKVAVELYSHSVLALEDVMLCSNFINLKKLDGKNGMMKAELLLYSESEKSHIASIYLELERRIEVSQNVHKPMQMMTEVAKRIAT